MLQTAIWNGDVRGVELALKNKCCLEKRDFQGNRAVHLAIKCAGKNQKEIIRLLLEYGGRIRSKDGEGWKVIQNAMCTGDEELVKNLLRMEMNDLDKLAQYKIRRAASEFKNVPDFHAVVEVELSSWVPLLSKLLPSDRIELFKVGNNLRIDTTLIGFEGMKWVRGNTSYMVLGDEDMIVVVDHDKKEVEHVFEEKEKVVTEEDLEEAVHLMWTNKAKSVDFSVEEMTVKRKVKWLSNKVVVEDIGDWSNANVYDVSGLQLKIKSRMPCNPNHVLKTKDKSSLALDDLLDKKCMVEDKQKANIVIPAGNVHEIVIDMVPDDDIEWTFLLEKLDIEFQAIFQANAQVDQLYEKQKITSTQGEMHGTFHCKQAGTLVLLWDNTYSMLRKKSIALYIHQNNSKSTLASNLPHTTTKIAKKKVTFEEYFGQPQDILDPDKKCNPTAYMWDTPPCSTYVKNGTAVLHMSSQVPLTVTEFLPIIQVLAKTSSHLENVKQFFESQLPPGFPVQFTLPLAASISATISFTTVTLIKENENYFQIPKNYEWVKQSKTPIETKQTLLCLSEKCVS